MTRKKEKAVLRGELQQIDEEAKRRELSPMKWRHRYDIEKQLGNIYMEEIFWRQRARKQWLAIGDSNTRFFHQFANGRRRKSTIVQLDTDLRPITDQQEIMDHVVQFYVPFWSY